MTRKTGAVLVAALALSVAVLGLFLCMRCERAAPVEKAPPGIDTLMIGDGVQAE